MLDRAADIFVEILCIVLPPVMHALAIAGFVGAIAVLMILSVTPGPA